MKDNTNTDAMAVIDMLDEDIGEQLKHIASSESGAVERLRPHLPAIEEHLRQALFLLEEGAA